MLSTLIRKKNWFFIIGALSFGFQVVPAFATTAILNFSNPTLDLSGNGSLDISSQLDLLPNTSASFIDGLATFNFLAGTTPATYSGYIGYFQGSCGIFSGCSGYIFNYYYQYNMLQQTAQVKVGSTSTQTDSPHSSDLIYIGTSQDGANRNINYNQINHTNGPFSISMILDQTALSELNKTGALSFQSNVSNSGIDLYGVTYSGNYSVMAVPEPKSYAMLMVGLGLISFTSRLRNVAK